MKPFRAYFRFLGFCFDAELFFSLIVRSRRSNKYTSTSRIVLSTPILRFSHIFREPKVLVSSPCQSLTRFRRSSKTAWEDSALGFGMYRCFGFGGGDFRDPAAGDFDRSERGTADLILFEGASEIGDSARSG